jgi:hypothetical protein
VHIEIKEDLRAIREKVESIDKNVAINTKSLETHMARTEANEQRIVYLERVLITLSATAVLGGIVKLLIS